MGHLALHPQRRAYFGITAIESFEPWLALLESRIDKSVLMELAGHIPSEWYDSDLSGLLGIVEQLEKRRKEVRKLVESLHASLPRAFPNWAKAPSLVVGVGGVRIHSPATYAVVGA